MINLHNIEHNLPNIFTNDKVITLVKYQNKCRYLINYLSPQMRAIEGEFWSLEIKFSYVSVETKETISSVSKCDSTSG
jgi:hypothetical protein